MDALSRIRQEVVNRKKEESKKEELKKCPLCNNPVVVEKTLFFETELCTSCFDHAVINEIESCCGNPDMIQKKYIIANGAIQVRNQCESCGFVSPTSIGGVDPVKRQQLPAVDTSRKEAREAGRTAARCEFFKVAREGRQNLRDQVFQNESLDWWNKYNTYLKTTIWFHKRLTVLNRDNYLCQSCLNPETTATQVHHLSYKHVDFKGGEPAFELVSVCQKCHDFIHNKSNI